MQAGAEFKPFVELLVPDPSSTMYELLDRSVALGFRPLTVADTYAEMDVLSLPESVPNSVRGYYDATRMMWVYGWYYYPFYTWAVFHAATCVEMGLRLRIDAEGRPVTARQPSFQTMLRHAVKHNWLSLNGFSSFRDDRTGQEDAVPDLTALLGHFLQTFRRVRNSHAHPSQFGYVLPGHGYRSVRFAHDVLIQLFPPTI